MSDLEKLRNCRDQLLLAEIVGYLHDYRKCSDEQLQVQSKNRPSNAHGLPRDRLIDSFPFIESATLSILNNSVTLDRLLNYRTKQNSSILCQYLSRCHNTAHIDKQEPPKGEGEQDHNSVFLSSVFGYESTQTKVLIGLTQQLFSSINWRDLCQFQDRYELYSNIEKLFSQCGADTRRPINEITLWSWGHTVGALFKASLAGALVGFKPNPPNLQWRLLSIRLDGFAYFMQSAGLPDLLARQTILAIALDKIQELLEVDYPLGSEVYRDENGCVFVVPGCEKENCSLNLLAIQNGDKTLRQHILDTFFQVIEGEIVPEIEIDPEPWWGQDPYWKDKSDNNIPSNDVLAPISEHLKATSSDPLPEWVNEQWMGSTGQICTVCGLRPQGYGAHDRLEHYRHKTLKKECLRDCQTCKAIKRGVCSICEQRRDDRSMRWAQEKLNTTIWTDEVADANGRLALVVGCFDLTRWLSGDLVRTMAVCNPANSDSMEAEKVAKNPSFARLRRIWETTQGFWQEVYPTDESKNLHGSLMGCIVGLDGPRLEIRGKLQEKNGTETPGPFHAYDLVLSKGIKLSVAWDPEEGKQEVPKGRFITIDNLTYLASLAGKKVPSREKDESEENYSLRLKNWAAEKLIQGSILIEESTGYGGKAKEWGKINVDCIDIVPGSRYTPAISILAEPRTFMALVPADKALEVVNKIKAKYEQEMGKVRNRLPLHLGIVYAHRRTPLRAILDAGRRMLDQKYIGDPDAWTVTDNVTEQSEMLPHRAAYLSEDSSQFTKWYPVCLKHQEINRELIWYVPAVMGDGTTSDNWYPYVFWRRDSDGNTEPANATVPRSRYFKSPNPWKKKDSAEPDWLVHAGELKEGDLIYFTPATLDFQWLDSAGRRFEIAYDKRGQRFSTPRRPYLLDEIEILNEIWQTLSSHLTKNQIYILRDLIEAKREDWNVKTPNPGREDVFWRFCRNALANVQWNKGKRDNRMDKLPWEVQNKDCNKWLDQWTDYAVRGWITDAIELHLQIMKEEVQDEF